MNDVATSTIDVDPTLFKIIVIFIFTLAAKIIWDWLSKKNSTTDSFQVCPYHDSVQKDAKCTRDSVILLKTDFVTIKDFKEEMKTINYKMDNLNKDLVDIKISIAEHHLTKEK